MHRWNTLHPLSEPRASHIEKMMRDSQGPTIVATDYIKNHADQLRAYLPPPIHVLGTDGYGRSDSREALREFFEVDRNFIVVSALKALSDIGKLDKKLVSNAIVEFGIDQEKKNPLFL